MEEVVKVYIKQGCPYSAAAKDDLRKRNIKFKEFDVEADPAYLQEMLKFSGGKRSVPVIVEGEKVTVGFGGT